MRIVFRWVAAIVGVGMLLPQEVSHAVLANPETANWRHDATDPAGSESVVLRGDTASGPVEIYTRYPAGHVFSPHWHSANERILLLEGELAIRVGSAATTLRPGGYAYLPAHEVQRMSCVSRTRCAFYVAWDATLDFHPAPQ